MSVDIFEFLCVGYREEEEEEGAVKMFQGQSESFFPPSLSFLSFPPAKNLTVCSVSAASGSSKAKAVVLGIFSRRRRLRKPFLMSYPFVYGSVYQRQRPVGKV